MRKLNSKQKALIKQFIVNNPTAGVFAPATVIDPSGSIENLNYYESCWADIERFYSDNFNKIICGKP